MSQEKYQPTPEEIRKAQESLTREQQDQSYGRLWEIEQTHNYPSIEARQQAYEEIKTRIEREDDTVFEELFSQRSYGEYTFALEFCMDTVSDWTKGRIKEGLNNLFRNALWGAYMPVLVKAIDRQVLSENEAISELGKFKNILPPEHTSLYPHVINMSKKAKELMQEGKLS